MVIIQNFQLPPYGGEGDACVLSVVAQDFVRVQLLGATTYVQVFADLRWIRIDTFESVSVNDWMHLFLFRDSACLEIRFLGNY